MADLTTYVPIATVTLGSATSPVTFSSIPSTYTDLILISSANTTNAGMIDVWYRFNGDTGTNYSRTGLYGNGSSAGSFRGSNEAYGYYSYMNGTSVGTNVFSENILQIQNYANATTYKTSLSRTAAQGDSAIALVSLWRSTSAINSISVSPASGSFNTGSTFTLYGIKAA